MTRAGNGKKSGEARYMGYLYRTLYPIVSNTLKGQLMRGVFRNIQVKRPCFRLGQISLRNSGSLFWRTTKKCRSQVPGLVPGSIPRHIAVTWILPRSLPAWRKQRKRPPNVADKIVARSSHSIILNTSKPFIYVSNKHSRSLLAELLLKNQPFQPGAGKN